MVKKILFSILVLGVLSVFSPKAYADCQPIYGGGQNCTSFNFTINKMVQMPNGSNFVDNLSINDPKFSPSQTVNYELIVTNTGNQTIPTLNVTDTFPQFISFVSGAGSFNSSNNTLSFTISNLGAGQSQTFNLVATTASSSTLPGGITCVVNQANANDTHGDNASDSSQVCIQNGVVPTPTPVRVVLPATTVKVTPPTGPELIPLALLFPGALGGLFLRKKSKKISFEGGEK
jgi:uncharacterized repeat protein (TIGR01451 family)